MVNLSTMWYIVVLCGKKFSIFAYNHNLDKKLNSIIGTYECKVAKDLSLFANISKDVVLSSAVNIIEIWDKDLYEKSIDSSELDFAELAEKVMGNLNEDEDGIS